MFLPGRLLKKAHLRTPILADGYPARSRRAATYA
jgi:hypothetical protein